MSTWTQLNPKMVLMIHFGEKGLLNYFFTNNNMTHVSLSQDPKSATLDKDRLFANASIQIQNDIEYALEFQRNVFENRFASDVSFLPFVSWLFSAAGNWATRESYWDQEPPPLTWQRWAVI